jgi:hypothetical protein
MPARFPRLISLLGRTIDLLKEHGVPTWPGILDDIRTKLETAQDSESAAPPLASIRNMVGVQTGVGSFGDLVISDQVGHPLPADDMELANTQLEYLKHELFLEASQAMEEAGLI